MPEHLLEALNDSNGIAAPPLFSPHVYVAEKHERLTFESGYTGGLASSMVLNYDELYPLLLMAKKHNIPVTWYRNLEINVHEAWALRPLVGFSVHDVRCKVDVCGEIGRTELQNLNAEQKIVWNQTFKFAVRDSCDISLLIYCKNSIIPNDKLGRVWVKPSQLVERKTVTEWFPLNTNGELKLSITLSPPLLEPLKFVFSSRLSFSSRDSNIYNANNEKIFTLIGKWPYSISLLDNRSISLLTLKNCVNESHEREYTLYLYGQSTHTLTLTQTCGIAESEFQIEGLPSVAEVKMNQRSFGFFSPSNERLAYARLEEEKYFVDITAGADTIVILGTMALIAKLLYAEGKETKPQQVKTPMMRMCYNLRNLFM
jgi:hypothetical protein